MSFPSLALAGTLMLAPAGAEPVAPAQTEPPAAVSEPVRVLVIVRVSTSADIERAVEAATIQLEREGVIVETIEQPASATVSSMRALARDHQARGVFWFDESDPKRLQMFLATEQAVFVRPIDVDPLATEATVDTAWHILQSSSLALAMGQRVEMQEVEVEPEPVPVPVPVPVPEPPPEPEPKKEPRARVALQAGYLGEGFASSVPWQSGVTVGLPIDIGKLVRLGVDYGLLFPWTSGDPAIKYRHQFTLHVGVHGRLNSRFDLGGRLFGGAEIVQWRGTDGEGIRPMATLGAELVGEIAIVRGLYAFFGLGANALLTHFEFVECEMGATSCTGDQRNTLLEPWWVRPRARAGLGWRF